MYAETGLGNLILLFMTSFEWRIVPVQALYRWSNITQEKPGPATEARSHLPIITLSESYTPMIHIAKIANCFESYLKKKIPVWSAMKGVFWIYELIECEVMECDPSDCV